jgi:tetratricopeptide (TPR) repeat protein
LGKKMMRKLFARAVFLAMMAAAGIISAQNGVSISFEMQSAEKIIASRDSAPAERYEAFARLARLRQLAGDVEGAARNWLEAATAVPDKIDDDALLACAYCLAAMGEWDRASAALAPLLHKSPRAMFLELVIKARKTGDISALAAIADKPEYSPLKSEVCFMLWKLSDGAETWKRRLLAECSESPEARLAADEAQTRIIVKASPFWLFMNSFSTEETAVFFPALEAQPDSPQSLEPAAVRLQTGLFRQRANAVAQSEKLKKAGFSPSMEQRSVNGNEAWAVTVPAGRDVSRGIKDLREAGFDSFPVR